MSADRLLIVDDEPNVRASLQEYFEREGFRVSVAADGPSAIRLFDHLSPDLAILDVQLLPHPTVGGLELCRELRARFGQAVGIIMISGVRREEVDQIVGYELGADYYLLKPVSNRLLLAQVKALLRMVEARQSAAEGGGWYKVDDHLHIHLGRRLVEAGGQGVTLTEQEFAVLAYLAKHYGEPVTRTDLIEAVWQYDEGVSDAAVNTCIARLRKKIEPDPAHPRYIHTHYDLGYRFEVRPQQPRTEGS
jgi:DNA-binding response OmpR family regulator